MGHEKCGRGVEEPCFASACWKERAQEGVKQMVAGWGPDPEQTSRKRRWLESTPPFPASSGSFWKTSQASFLLERASNRTIPPPHPPKRHLFWRESLTPPSKIESGKNTLLRWNDYFQVPCWAPSFPSQSGIWCFSLWRGLCFGDRFLSISPWKKTLFKKGLQDTRLF